MLRFVRSIVNVQNAQLGKLLGIIQQQALSPLRMIIQQVLGGVWKGQGANAFVEELNKMAIPGVGNVGQHLTLMSQKIRFAEQVIDRADEAAGRMVKDRITSCFRFF